MKVAVFGSWRGKDKENWALDGECKAFCSACRQLGGLLAQRADQVLVGYDQEDEADTYIVDGVLSASRRKKGCRLQVFRNKERPVEVFRKAARQHPGMFQFLPPSDREWEAACDAIQRADLVVLIGGAAGTLIAGLTSILAGKRIVPIGAFGGAANRLLERLVRKDEELFSLRDELASLRSTWCPKQLAAVERLLSFPRVLLVHGRSRDWRNVERFLRRNLQLPRPVVMMETFGGAQTLTEKWEFLAPRVDCAIVVATPDDYATAILDEDGLAIEESARTYTHRARQNVWLELGWFWGCRGRQNVLLLQKGRLEVPSDLAVERYTYHHDPLERRREINSFVRTVGRSLATRCTL